MYDFNVYLFFRSAFIVAQWLFAVMVDVIWAYVFVSTTIKLYKNKYRAAVIGVFCMALNACWLRPMTTATMRMLVLYAMYMTIYAYNARNAFEKHFCDLKNFSMIKSTAFRARKKETNTTSSDIEPEASLGTCVICLDVRSSVSFVPCGHACVCDSCAEDLYEQENELACPICKRKTLLMQPLYL